MYRRCGRAFVDDLWPQRLVPGAPPGISTEFKSFSHKVFDAEMPVVVVGQWPQETTTQKSWGTGFIGAIPCGNGPIKAYVRNSILTDNVSASLLVTMRSGSLVTS
jgi:hypothetical protein